MNLSAVLPYLDQVHSEVVDGDLSEIAEHCMLNWEEHLAIPLGLTADDKEDIKTAHPDSQVLQRYRPDMVCM